MSIKDIGDGWLNFLMVKFFNKELPPATKKIVEERFNTCISCDHLKKKTFKSSKTILRFCDICKCSFPGMIFSRGKKCPDGRWDSIQEEFLNQDK
jgi:hypothetical protein